MSDAQPTRPAPGTASSARAVDVTGAPRSSSPGVFAPPEVAARPAAGRRAWWVRPVAWAVTFTGLILVGMSAGQLWFAATVVEGPPVPAVTAAPGQGEAPLSTGLVVMPNVLGLDAATVARVLADGGVTAQVVRSEAPAAGPVGVVTSQVPRPGDPVEDVVEVVLSAELVVPGSVVGAAAAVARAELEALGAVVQVVRTVDPTQSEGVVLASDPAPGQVLGSVIVLTVADAGQALAFGDMDTVARDGCGGARDASVNGVAVDGGIGCSLNEGEVSFGEWVLARQGVLFEALAGVEDSGQQGSGVVRIFGDGVLLVEVPVSYGASSAVRVDVSGVLRLRVEAQPTAGEPFVVLGDALVRGTQEQVDAIAAAQ